MIDARAPEGVVHLAGQRGALAEQQAGQERGRALGQLGGDSRHRPALDARGPGRGIRGERPHAVRAPAADERDALAAELGGIVEPPWVPEADGTVQAQLRGEPLSFAERRALSIDRDEDAPRGRPPLRVGDERLDVEEQPRAIRAPSVAAPPRCVPPRRRPSARRYRHGPAGAHAPAARPAPRRKRAAGRLRRRGVSIRARPPRPGAARPRRRSARRRRRQRRRRQRSPRPRPAPAVPAAPGPIGRDRRQRGRWHARRRATLRRGRDEVAKRGELARPHAQHAAQALRARRSARGARAPPRCGGRARRRRRAVARAAPPSPR